jgi:serine phosphatase RsbU (regulator of sigma subunit)
MDAGDAGETRSHERAVARLLRDSHVAADFDLPDLFDRHAADLGVGDAVVYLADLQQRLLVPFVGLRGGQPEMHVETLNVDSTLAGRAYQRIQVLTQTVEGHDSEVRVWLPMLDGTERLGVLAVTVASETALDEADGLLRERLMLFATLASELVVSKTLYGDTVVRLRRTSSMGLAAEMQWSLLPPLTYADGRVTIAAGLEPAYEVAGDALDYAVGPDRAHLAIFDGMGHGLRSAQLAGMAVAAYRNARRARRSLPATVHAIEAAVNETFDGGEFLTGQVAELDLDSGLLTWVNAGHPSPLLLRDGRLVRPLDCDVVLPFGLHHLTPEDGTLPLGTETLQPGDQVLFYSDGVVEARSPEGEFFGTERLVDLVVRNLAAGLPAPETMRRVVRALLDHQQGQLDDDASLFLVQYRPESMEPMLP